MEPEPPLHVLPYAPPVLAGTSAVEARHWRDLTSEQKKTGLAAWLGWFFDGLDMHLYTLVAAPFVAHLLGVLESDPRVKEKAGFIQAAFLIGWAIGGAFFGRLGDLIGRSKSLSLTIITYAAFTGASFFVTTWWQLLITRFIAALGIGGEWAVGSSLLSETWPKKWRPWIAAVLQTGVNLGVIAAFGVAFAFAGHEKKYVFLVGISPALLVYWIRKAVPEPAEWHEAKTGAPPPSVSELFRGATCKITILTMLVCASSLTAWWAFMFWINQHWKHLPVVKDWTKQHQEQFGTSMFGGIIGISIAGNFFAGWLAKQIGYRRAISLLTFSMFISVYLGFRIPRGHLDLMPYVLATGFFSGVFGLFTMYLPPLFPTLLRTTGAGFCYNIGRIAAAIGTIIFGLKSTNGDLRPALLVVGFLFIPATVIAWFMPDHEAIS